MCLTFSLSSEPYRQKIPSTESAYVLVDVENTGGLARLPVDRLARDAKGNDRSSVFKIPLPIESIHLRHRWFDFVGLRRPSNLQALEQAFDRVRVDHIPLHGFDAEAFAIQCCMPASSANPFLSLGRPAATPKSGSVLPAVASFYLFRLRLLSQSRIASSASS
jgi:hypothetical protein